MYKAIHTLAVYEKDMSLVFTASTFRRKKSFKGVHEVIRTGRGGGVEPLGSGGQGDRAGKPFFTTQTTQTHTSTLYGRASAAPTAVTGWVYSRCNIWSPPAPRPTRRMAASSQRKESASVRVLAFQVEMVAGAKTHVSRGGSEPSVLSLKLTLGARIARPNGALGDG